MCTECTRNIALINFPLWATAKPKPKLYMRNIDMNDQIYIEMFLINIIYVTLFLFITLTSLNLLWSLPYDHLPLYWVRQQGSQWSVSEEASSQTQTLLFWDWTGDHRTQSPILLNKTYLKLWSVYGQRYQCLSLSSVYLPAILL